MTTAFPLSLSLQAPTALFPGAGGEDETCAYPELPQMRTFAAPSLYDLRPDARGGLLLRDLRERLEPALRGEVPASIDLLGEARETIRFLEEILGQGEVSIRGGEAGRRWSVEESSIRGGEAGRRWSVEESSIRGGEAGRRWSVEESVYAGIWRERVWRDEVLMSDALLAAPIPPSVLEWAERLTEGHDFLQPEYPPGLMNAPSLLFEILAKARDYRPGAEDILNLSLFPLSPEDSAFLDGQLGRAGLEILARGYGDCRIELTRVPRVWRVRYFNSTAQLILDTLEICPLPQVALAAAEDLEDSGQRLDEVLDALA